MSAEATANAWRTSPWKGQHAKFVIHLAVADVVNDAHGNEFWMAHASLAAKAGCRRATVVEWFREAVGLGLVEVLEDNAHGGRPNRYRLVLEGCTPTVQGVSADRTGGVRSPYTELKTTKENSTTTNSSSSTDAVAGRVVDAWVVATGRDAAKVKVNAKRVAVVKARLNEGYTEVDLVAAVQGIALSAWHMGDNPNGKRYDDLTVALRDGERVEKFRDLLAAGGDRGRMSATDRALELYRQELPELGTGS